MSPDSAPTLPFTLDGTDILLAVRLTPRARRDEIMGIVATGENRWALAIRSAAPPVEGAANKALIALLAGRLQIAKSGVTIASGDKSRVKIVRLKGVSADALQALLD